MATAIEDDALEAVGLARLDLQQLAALEPQIAPPAAVTPEAFDKDAIAASRFWLAGQALIARLPSRAARSAREQAAVEALSKRLREVRVRFLRSYAPLLSAEL